MIESMKHGRRSGQIRYLPSLQRKKLTLANFTVLIHFYMPEHCLPSVEEREGWMSGELHQLAQSGKAASAQAWIYRTFLNLSTTGARVELRHQIPKEGVFVALTGNLPRDFKCPEWIYLIGVVADGIPHPACHFHILQNAKHAARLARSTYIPHWPQPGLAPRNRERGDRFENIYFFGDPPNLAPELRDPSFSNSLREGLGLNLVIAGSNRWHDYSEADCVIAIREFGTRDFLGKPSTKLYNAWMAGVPFIGGSDAAFERDGMPGIDYLRCDTLQSVFTALEQLKDNTALRHRLVTEGSCSARHFTSEAITVIWTDFIDRIIATNAPDHFSQSLASKKLKRLIQRIDLSVDRYKGGF